MSRKRASSDAPKALRAEELRGVMDAIRGGPQEDPPFVPDDELEGASGDRRVGGSGVYRVAQPDPVWLEPGAPVSSAPPALRPHRLADVLASIDSRR